MKTTRDNRSEAQANLYMDVQRMSTGYRISHKRALQRKPLLSSIIFALFGI